MGNNFPSPAVDLPDALADVGRRLDKLEIDRCIRLSRNASLVYTTAAPQPALPSVDHSMHISYIRHQGAYGCGLNAAAAYWDIIFHMYCWPNFHPNMSVNRLLWGWRWPLMCFPEDQPCGQRSSGKIPGLWGVEYLALDSYLRDLGCPTEGTEPTNSDAIQWPADEGNYECCNYRLDKHPQSFASGYGLNTPEFQELVKSVGFLAALCACGHNVKVDLNELKYWLKGGPVRVGIWGDHFVTLVGYDDNKARLKFINSWGDRWHHSGADDGYGFVSYDHLNQEIDSAQVYQLQAPKSVPCAKIILKSGCRQDVHLWLGFEGKPAVKRIWPTGQRQDNSLNLSIIVTLPRSSTWPPSADNRVFLDVYDTGAHSNAGGTIEEFTVGFCGQYHYCGDIVQGTPNNIQVPIGNQIPGAAQWVCPKSFKPREMIRITVP